MKTSKFRPGTIALAVTVLTVPVAVLAAAPKFTMVTGVEAVTIPAQQSETAYNVSQLGGGTRVETIAYNDKSSEAPTFLVYGADTRTIFPGASLMGWSFVSAHWRTPIRPGLTPRCVRLPGLP